MKIAASNCQGKGAYIKLEDALRIVEQVITDNNIKHTGKAIRKRLKELPAEDVVEIVRCKDCEYWIFEERCSYLAPYPDEPYTSAEDFCGYGKRKEGAEK